MDRPVAPEIKLILGMWRDAEREVTTLRVALRAMQDSAQIFLSRPTDDVAFAHFIDETAGAALFETDGVNCDAEPDADGGFNGEPLPVLVFGAGGGEADEPEHDDGQTDSRYCAECDGPCDVDR